MNAAMNFVAMFFDEFVTLFAEMAPFLLLGFLLAGVIVQKEAKRILLHHFQEQ